MEPSSTQIDVKTTSNETNVPSIDKITITHFGTATLLIEIGTLRILTDPAFDPIDTVYSFGWGLGTKKLTKPIVDPNSLGKIDCILLSHDHHADNLDDAGRKLLPSAGIVLTTVSGEGRLSAPPSSLKNVKGLKDWQSHQLTGPDSRKVSITATPARHGPPLSGFIVGDVIGFVLEWEGQKNGALYISGDTVRFSGVDQISTKFNIGTSILHLGSVQFGLTGPIRYTFSGEEAAQVAKNFKTKKILPIHYEGWSHFQEDRKKSEESFKKAGLEELVQWLVIGEPTLIEI